MKRGKLLVIEGTDGAGKSSQVKLITEFFSNNNLKVKQFHFPTYTHNEAGSVITSFLQGNFGKSSDVNPYFIANIYALDRFLFLPELNKMLEENDIVILDRYVFSNAAYQSAKFEIGSKESIDIIKWIIELEFGFFSLPDQDLCIFLHVPMDIIEKRLASERQGEDREYLSGKKDIHEEDLELQKRVNHTYLNLDRIYGAELREYMVIDCQEKNPAEIFELYVNNLTNMIS